MVLVPDGRAALDDLGADLVRMFEHAESTLMRKFARQIKEGLAEHPDEVLRAVQLGTLRVEAQRLYTAITQFSSAEVERIVAIAVEKGSTAALAEAAKVSGTRNLAEGVAAANVTQFGIAATGAERATLLSLPAAAAVQTSLLEATQTAARAILRWPDDVYRKAIQQSATDVLLGVQTGHQAQAQAWQQLVASTGPTFRDKAGRNWETSTYVETATRTATRRAWDVQSEATMARAGLDLVTIVVGNGSCKACADVAGKVWSVDGSVQGKVELQSEVDEGTVTVDVEGSLDDARRHGWRHPNCRCHPVAYLPGLPAVSQQTTYDPKAEGERNRLRYLEREVRRSKRMSAAAIDEEQRRKAETRLRNYQAKIREHVATTGLTRHRRREQVDLGNG